MLYNKGCLSITYCRLSLLILMIGSINNIFSFLLFLKKQLKTSTCFVKIVLCFALFLKKCFKKMTMKQNAVIKFLPQKTLFKSLSRALNFLTFLNKFSTILKHVVEDLNWLYFPFQKMMKETGTTLLPQRKPWLATMTTTIAVELRLSSCLLLGNFM